MSQPPVIHWFRRDLRLADNTALLAAQASGRPVVPVYIASDWTRSHRWTGPIRQEFLCDCLTQLHRSLEAVGSRLVVRKGNAPDQLQQLIRETGATAIYANRDPDPFGRQTEAKLAGLLKSLGVELHFFKDCALHERDEVLTGSGTPFKVFTPYSRAWGKLPKTRPGKSLRELHSPLTQSVPLPTLADWGLIKSGAHIPLAGEAAARMRLNAFLDAAATRYADLRNLPAVEGTSRISQDLRFGLLSIREVYWAVHARMEGANLEERRSLQTFLNELCWREFYFQVLWHWPEVLDSEFSIQFRGLPWKHDSEKFERWCLGQTGFPIVDAGMRQLRQTGFMHNRVRMITAMFLTKDLQIDWREGEKWFMQHLLDGEIAANNGGWQWSAGTGTDAAPYFRIQNPWTQTNSYDPECEYVKHWVPELEKVPAARLKTPPAPGLRLVPNYPLPVVDHQKARDAALDLYKRHLGR